MEFFGGDQFDVIVVGAGIMGSCTAHQVAKRGHRILLLEQFDFLHCGGSSHGESRTIRATYPDAYFQSMAMESAQLWEEAQSEIGYRVHFKASQFDMGPSDDKSLRAAIRNCRSSSVPHRVLEPGQVSDRFLGRIEIPENWIGLSTDLGGVLKPTKAVAMFQTLALQKGAVLRDNMKVKDIRRDEGTGLIMVCTSNGEKFWARKCVVTAGAWMQKLVKSVSGLELPIQPLETYVYYWRIKDGFGPDYSIGSNFPTFASYGELYVYGTPSLEFPGLIKVALHRGLPCDPDKRLWASNVVLDPMKKWIERTFMGRVDSSRPIVTQSCLYSMTPDEDFVIDFVGGEVGKDVVIGGGFSGHGFKMGPLVGRILADLALDGEAKGVELRQFRLGRFEVNPKGNVKEI
ncbi:probable sarcosine oxidase [Malania oleifera]|uniref:probable sarcosine oxidase n=1 Tax=Malania oleifera TaxID=397392 RepID=UPI0025AE8F67|nr:probable sarcosine oxidase [Malania oleifera]